MKKRYVIVGAGMRCYTMFVRNLLDHFSDYAEIVGVYDTNKVRSAFFKSKIGDGCTQYFSFEEMLSKERPDAVIVTTPDSFHHEYIVRALDLGFDAISEKPITNTYERCLEIMEAEKRSGKRVTVTFNCRYMPFFTKVKEIVASGKLGRIMAINYDYYVNRTHGADYFKRWHRLMEFSEGMLLHKSTHHFDIINWILEDEPRLVTALADKIYYSDNSKMLSERCRNCEGKDSCESALMQFDELSEELYYKAESEDGYIRDKCAFSEGSDIYDNMSVSVKYGKGTLLTYALNLFSQKEGFRLVITGEDGAIVARRGDLGGGKNGILLLDREGNAEEIEFDDGEGSHMGGDLKLLSHIFAGDSGDPLGRRAKSFDGFSSALIGIGANISIKEGKTVDLTPYLNKLR